MSKLKTYFGLPSKVIFCKKTLISNQRPNSAIEFEHNIKTQKKTLYIDKNGLSDSWKYSRIKKRIDFQKRERQLLELLNKHRGRYGEYDCIVPGSGGKDSCFAAHILKYKYGMNPLTVTWPPILYTDYGYQNFKQWINTGKFKNISASRDEKTMIKITKLGILNLMHPFQTFMLGQKFFAPKMALKYKIPLIFYGENEAEHGNPIADNSSSLREKSYFAYKNIDKIYLGGVKYRNLINDHNIKEKNLLDFLPASNKEIERFPIEVHYLGYYLKWTPQETFYYAVDNCGFKPRPFRTQGTYSKYNSIDDKIDDLHYYTTFIKFGLGRATYDVSQEIRNDHITTQEGRNLIKKYDGEFPDRYFDEILKYLKINKEIFFSKVDKFRSPHLWVRKKNKWQLRHTANRDGADD
jgi:N-acetyl sugar amidotransferase